MEAIEWTASQVNASAFDLDRFNTEMGRRVRVRRELLRLSSAQLSEKTGLRNDTIAAFEAGEAMMPASVVFSMAKALKVDLNYFWAAGSQPAPRIDPGERPPALRIVK